MIGYVTRDLDDETLKFHYIKPHRVARGVYFFWISNDRAFTISDNDFPEFKSLTWKDKPLRVGFNIHKANIQD